MADRVGSLAGPDGIFVNQHHHYFSFVETCRGLIEAQKELKVKMLGVVCFVFLTEDRTSQLPNKRNIFSTCKHFID